MRGRLRDKQEQGTLFLVLDPLLKILKAKPPASKGRGLCFYLAGIASFGKLGNTIVQWQWICNK
jgi:hypothetical protein